WAVRSGDVSAEAARLRTAGITVSAPSKSGRKRPDGFQLDWETARVGTERNLFPISDPRFHPARRSCISERPADDEGLFGHTPRSDRRARFEGVGRAIPAGVWIACTRGTGRRGVR